LPDSEAFGQVSFVIISAIIVKDKNSGQHRGFGFVEIPDQTEAQAASESLNEKDLLGQQMSVNEEVRPRTDRRSLPRGTIMSKVSFILSPRSFGIFRFF
jgi:RNA recognition motif-containing protein